MKKEEIRKEFPERFMLIVQGNGLNKAGIKNGSIVSVESTDKAKDGDIVFASIIKDGRETFSLSRDREVNGEIHLCSETDDKTYLPFTVAFPTNLKIYGKVIRCANMLDERREGGRHVE